MARNKLYKPLKDSGLIARGKFTMDTAFAYLVVVIAAFHLLPLCFIAFGETGKMLLTNYCMVLINPIMIFCVMLIYGVKIGFNFKMPLLCAALSAVSVLMYYDFVADAAEGVLYYPLVSTAVMLIVYGVFAFGANLIGALIKHYLV